MQTSVFRIVAAAVVCVPIVAGAAGSDRPRQGPGSPPTFPVAQGFSPASAHVIPQPVRMTMRRGAFVLTPRTIIRTDAASVGLGHQLARHLDPPTGFSLRVRSGGQPPARAIVRVSAVPGS